jgi:hypothetical protein
MTIALVIAMFIGYALLVWTIKKMRIAKTQAQFDRLRDFELAAIRAKYAVPLMTEAQIAEMHASRWMGD